MFEIGGVRADVAQEALHLASAKLPIACKIISREEEASE
jgi:ribosomal protein L16/L10AE